LAAAAVLVLLLFSAMYPLSASQAVAYVSVDINPSLELGVSRNLKVVSANALNPEAADLIAELELKGLPLTEALDVILLTAEEKEYFTGDSPAVVLAGTPTGKRDQYMEGIQSQLEETVDSYVAESASPVAVAVVTSIRETREEAKELGLSVGKYAVLMEARNEGLKLGAQDLRDKGIGRALLDLEVQPKDVLRRVNGKKEKPATPVRGKKKPEVDSNKKQHDETNGTRGESNNLPTDRNLPAERQLPSTPPRSRTNQGR
jgi:hypothetical protein